MDLHERFDEWLTAGAEGDPPRDLALHASSCEACLRSVAALDSIQAIEIGDAPLPPLRMAPEGSDRLPRVLRYAAGTAAVMVLATSVAIGAPALFRTADPVSSPAPTPSTADDCADTLDNDDDGFVDELDPGCILSGNEADA